MRLASKLVMLTLIAMMMMCSLIGCIRKNENDNNPNEALTEVSTPHNIVISSQEEAWALLSKKLSLNKKDFDFMEPNEYGGYVFTTAPEAIGSGNGITYAVDAENGNIYDEVSEQTFDNVFFSGEQVVLGVDEISTLLVRIEEINAKSAQFSGAAAGWNYYSLYNDQKEVVEKLKVDPASGAVYYVDTAQLVINLKSLITEATKAESSLNPTFIENMDTEESRMIESMNEEMIAFSEETGHEYSISYAQTDLNHDNRTDLLVLLSSSYFGMEGTMFQIYVEQKDGTYTVVPWGPAEIGLDEQGNQTNLFILSTAREWADIQLNDQLWSWTGESYEAQGKD